MDGREVCQKKNREEREEFEEEVDSDISESEEYEGLMSNFNYDWMKEGLPSSNYVTLEFLKKVVEIADELEIDPDDLMAVMAFESWITLDAGTPNTAYEKGEIIHFEYNRMIYTV